MNQLDTLFRDTINRELAPHQVASQIIIEKLKLQGITLSKRQIEKLRISLENSNLESIELELTKKQKAALRAFNHDNSENLALDITQDDLDRIDELIAKFPNMMTDMITSASQSMLTAWKSVAHSNIVDRKRADKQYEKDIKNTWQRSFRLMEILLGVCLELGQGFNESFRPEAVQTNNLVFEALVRLHARGCQIMLEIEVLLKGGLADGAHARWRTLHELTIIAMFISHHGSDVAQRYIEHVAIEDLKEARVYQQHCIALGFEPLNSTELEELELLKDKLIDKYGRSFGTDYGWAAETLALVKPTFVDIERSISMDHFRPFYKLANINVHGGSKSISFRIGLPPDRTDILLAGRSKYGLADPGQNAAFSMYQLTTILLLTKPNIDTITFARAIYMLMREVFEAFQEDEAELENH